MRIIVQIELMLTLNDLYVVVRIHAQFKVLNSQWPCAFIVHPSFLQGIDDVFNKTKRLNQDTESTLITHLVISIYNYRLDMNT